VLQDSEDDVKEAAGETVADQQVSSVWFDMKNMKILGQVELHLCQLGRVVADMMVQDANVVTDKPSEDAAAPVQVIVKLLYTAT